MMTTISYDFPKYGEPDMDVRVFLSRFIEPPGSYVLAVGDNEEYSANVLADNGYKVCGVDLREWKMPVPCNHDRFPQNFIEWATCLDRSIKFDVAYSLSALEHFGLGTYQEPAHPFDDVIACHEICKLLKPGGRFYFTVPFGYAYLEHPPHWRVYNLPSVEKRLIGRMAAVERAFFVSAPCVINGQMRKTGDVLSVGEACSYEGDPPHVTAFAKVIKT